MPKISAATVAEHHAQQHLQVLAAARHLMETERKVPALGEVAQRVGLARSSIYQYVSSRADLVSQLLVAVFEEWGATVGAAMEATGDDPQDRLHAYVHTNLDLFADWSGNALMLVATQEPGAMADPKVVKAHEILQPALIGALVDAGLPEAQARPYSQFLDTAIHRAADLIVQGSDRAAVVAALELMLRVAPD